MFSYSILAESTFIEDREYDIIVLRTIEGKYHTWVTGYGKESEESGKMLPYENLVYPHDAFAKGFWPATGGVVVVDKTPSKI